MQRHREERKVQHCANHCFVTCDLRLSSVHVGIQRHTVTCYHRSSTTASTAHKGSVQPAMTRAIEVVHTQKGWYFRQLYLAR